jgi:transketolase
MPSTTVFDRQDGAYRATVLPAGVRRVAIEAGIPDGWYKYVGLEGLVIGMDSFGESAPGPALFDHFGFAPAEIVARIEKMLTAQ